MSEKKATIYRMKTDQHICPYGLKSLHLLKRKSFQINDHKLRSREETDKFKEEHQVKTTPQTFINGQRIGGYDELREYFGKIAFSKKELKYQPIIAILLTCAFASIAIIGFTQFQWIHFLETFVALAMVVLAIQKLQDLDAFSLQFVSYDILAMRNDRYSYIYPFAEAYAGIGMLSAIKAVYFAPVSIFIGTIGAISVIKAVYIEKRDLKCACVGGNSKVPLGIISLSENLAMIGLGIWMLVK